MKKTITIAMLLLMLTVAGSMAQEPTVAQQPSRPKVAVVMSGGGAKGMAHIGVLKVLERAGIPVDIVTGTSMGSIIGGLYAIGYNASALDSMVRVQDWSYVITDREDLSRQSLGDRRKQNTYFITTGLTIGQKDINAGGFIKGKNLAELFQHLCAGYTDSLDFSRDLRIPFACVATNIVDNSEIVFHSGRLPQAMRASMAIPAAFSPVRIGGMVLVDGGLKNNYPADIARQMGADIIIGVTVQGEPKVAEDMDGLMSIISQIVDVNCKNKYDENLAITDLHLQVDTRGYGSASFSQSAIDTLIRRGEVLAMSRWDDIMALKRRMGLKASYRPAVPQPPRPQVMTEKHRVVGYTFENMTPQAERFVRQKFQLNRRDSIDAKLEQELTTCMRVDLFYQTAECRLVPEANGVRVILTAGNRKTAQLHGGVRYDMEEHVALQMGLDIPMKTAIPVNTDITLRLGKRLMARGEVTVHPRSFTRPSLSFTFKRNDIDAYMDGDLDYNVRYNQYQAEFLPVNFTLNRFNLQMGLRWDFVHYRSKLGSDDAMQVSLDDEHFYSYRARAEYNSEDNWYFPSRGTCFKAAYAYLTDNFANLDGKTGTSVVSGHWRMSLPLNRRFTLQPMVYGRMLFGSIFPPVFGNTVGGNWFGHYVEQQMPFAGIGNIEYAGRQFIAAQLQAQERIATNNYVLLRVAAAQQADRLGTLFDHRTLVGVQAAYFYNTMFGPVGALLGYSNKTRKVNFYINIGFQF